MTFPWTNLHLEIFVRCSIKIIDTSISNHFESSHFHDNPKFFFLIFFDHPPFSPIKPQVFPMDLARPIEPIGVSRPGHRGGGDGTGEPGAGRRHLQARAIDDRTASRWQLRSCRGYDWDVFMELLYWRCIYIYTCIWDDDILYIILYHIMLYYITLYYIILNYVMLYYIILYYNIYIYLSIYIYIYIISADGITIINHHQLDMWLYNQKGLN